MNKLDELKKELGPTPEELKQRWAEQCVDNNNRLQHFTYPFDPYLKLGFEESSYTLFGAIEEAAEEIYQESHRNLTKAQLIKLLVNDKFVAYINYTFQRKYWLSNEMNNWCANRLPSEPEIDNTMYRAKYQELSDKYDRDYDTLKAFL